MCSSLNTSENTSSQEPSIVISGVSKAYHVYPTPQHRLWQMLWPGREKKFYRDYLAIHNVDLQIYKGETVGIVGRNGAGKSTLLKMICGTLAPTHGNIKVRGNVAPLLMLGAGFNPDFTGRENTFMNASILGLSEQVIQSRLESIMDFADIGDFFDQPVKSYSSGMYSRLAFSVAINADPDILVIDEVLSVGDEAFTRKCFARIEEIKSRGATILFVSHSAGSVIELCDRAVLMEAGERVLTSDPKTVISNYQKLLYAPATESKGILEKIRAIDQGGESSTAQKITKSKSKASDTAISKEATSDTEASSEDYRSESKIESEDPSPRTVKSRGEFDFGFYDAHLIPQTTVEYVDKGAKIERARILDSLGRPVNVLHTGFVYTFAYRAKFTVPAAHARFGMMIKLTTGFELGGQVSHPRGEGVAVIDKGTEVDVFFQFKTTMAPGTYFLNAGVLAETDEGEEAICRVLDIAMFRVAPVDRLGATGRVDLSPVPPDQNRAELAFHH